MPLIDALILIAAGFVSGAINAVAGGGTFVAFGALTLVGLPPITANATSSIAQVPGYLASTLAYGRELRTHGRGVIPFVVVSVVGGFIGASTLLALDNDQFGVLVPWLLISATALFAAGPRLTRQLRERSLIVPRRVGWLIQFVVAIYGGFFGGGMGIMMLASLGLTEGTSDFHRLNAMKTLLSTVTAFVTLVVFSGGGAVSWPQAVVMLVAVALGGWGGVQAARRLPLGYVRAFVIAIGLVLTVYYSIV